MSIFSEPFQELQDLYYKGHLKVSQLGYKLHAWQHCFVFNKGHETDPHTTGQI